MAVVYHLGGFPPGDLDWPRLLPLIGPASAAIARYEGALLAVPNPDVLLSPLTSQEAVLSSRIEGTQTTLGEVLEFEAGGGPRDLDGPRTADIMEVLNYRAALREATRLLEDIPLSQRLIRRVHETLMQGVRGRNKAPGEFRAIPNWIGPEGSTIDNARYVPCGANHLSDAMDAWDTYLHGDEPDALVQLAILHAEFEAIHPFLDGNGRMGRLLIPLYLSSRGILARPNFYISAYLDFYRGEYFDRLLAVSRDGDWTGWCEFFLRALIEQAKSNQNKVVEIMGLYQDRKDWIAEATRSQYAVRALDWVFSRPIFRTSDFVATADIPKATASRILRILRDEGFLDELRPASGRRAAVVMFTDLLSIAEGHQAF